MIFQLARLPAIESLLSLGNHELWSRPPFAPEIDSPPAAPSRAAPEFAEQEFARAVNNADLALTLLRSMGVALSDVTLGGGVGAASVDTYDGKFWKPGVHHAALIQPVYKGGAIVDVIAWRPRVPHEWRFLRGEHGIALGMDNILDAIFGQQPIRLFRTPLDWLRGHCEGACLLSGAECLKLILDLPEIICQDPAHRREIDKLLRTQERRWPRLTVQGQ